MRGEHDLRGRTHDMDAGSSPHARGTPGAVEQPEVQHGIIPACAGNTTEDDNMNVWIGDHPRMRGEHYNNAVDSNSQQGSSPHARGTLIYLLKTKPPTGIIPACAGNTVSVIRPHAWNWDHPRMRGEHLCNVGWAMACRGIIPACAGNTNRI